MVGGLVEVPVGGLVEKVWACARKELPQKEKAAQAMIYLNVVIIGLNAAKAALELDQRFRLEHSKGGIENTINALECQRCTDAHVVIAANTIETIDGGGG